MGTQVQALEQYIKGLPKEKAEDAKLETIILACYTSLSKKDKEVIGASARIIMPYMKIQLSPN